MATIETNVFRDGQWQTSRQTIHSLLKGNTPQPPEPVPVPPPEPPSCGILTRTIIESPVVRHVLPARLRSRSQNDVVFVGVSLVLSQLLLPPAPTLQAIYLACHLPLTALAG